MNPPLFYDVTLRDGSHANRHGFTSEFCSLYIDKRILPVSQVAVCRLQDPSLMDVILKKIFIRIKMASMSFLVWLLRLQGC